MPWGHTVVRCKEVALGMRRKRLSGIQYSGKFGLRPMKSPIKSRAALVLAALLALGALRPPGARAQEPPPAAPPDAGQGDTPAKLVVNPTLVVVPVTVKDGNGNLVADLRKDEFRIFEDDVEQKLDVFTVEAFPLSIVVLIDNELKSKDAEKVQESLRSIVSGLSSVDEVFVCRFDQRLHQGKGFTRDQDKLLTELKRTEIDKDNPSVGAPGGPFNPPTVNGQAVTGGPSLQGATIALGGRSTKALDDSIYAAAELLKDRGRDRRKMIFLISDGVDSKKANTVTYDVALSTLQRYNIGLFGVGIGQAVFERRFTRMARYARDTGGDIYYAVQRQAMEELYARITEEARHQYTLAYVPRGTNRARDRHSIEVRVRREGLTILAREGYYSGGVR